jgi:Protein of unknown function (DUF1566)
VHRAVFLVLVCGVAAAGSIEPSLTRVEFPSGPGGGFGNLYLLGQQAVQQDLHLSADQLAKVRAAVRDVIDRQKDYAREKEPTRRKQLADETVQVRLRHDQEAVQLLTAPQAERLRQISLQYRATGAFYDSDVQAALKLTAEQLAKIRALGTETYSAWNREATAAFRKDKDFKAYQAKLAENRQRRDREQVEVLTAEQQARWKQMVGEPFKGPIPSPVLIAAASPDAAEEPGAVARLARSVETLSAELAKAQEELRTLRAENDRLRKQAGHDGAAAGGRPRFIDRGEFVEDTRTGLLWQKDGAASGKRNYYEAIKYATGLRLGGQAGWRVPTRAELGAIFPAVEAPFTNTQYNRAAFGKGTGEYPSYWTVTLDVRLPDYAYVYQWYADGGANNCSAGGNAAYVRCVHDPLLK